MSSEEVMDEHAHGFAAHAAEDGFDLFKAIVEDLFGVIFSAELDFFTKLLTFAIIISFVI